MLTAVAFYLFSAVAIAAAVMVIGARNPVHSVLFLILAFFNAAGLFILANKGAADRRLYTEHIEEFRTDL